MSIERNNRYTSNNFFEKKRTERKKGGLIPIYTEAIQLAILKSL